MQVNRCNGQQLSLAGLAFRAMLPDIQHAISRTRATFCTGAFSNLVEMQSLKVYPRIRVLNSHKNGMEQKRIAAG